MSEAPVPADKIIPLGGGNRRGAASLGAQSTAAQTPFATEAGHWYLPSGQPFYTVPNKSKPGQTRPVTITDAKKVGAVPSVTGITGLIKGEGLINYIRKQVFEATLQCPYPMSRNVNGIAVMETPDQHMARALAMAEQHKEKAAERGTSLHAAIELYLQGYVTSESDRWKQHVLNLHARLEQLGVDLSNGSPEKSFAHPLGYGGKCDWHYNCDACPKEGLGDCGTGLVIDFKSKDFIEPGKKYAYDEHAMQIASYAVGLGLSLRTVRGINVFIGEQDQRILVHEWPTPDLESAWEQFKHLLAVWQIRKKYCPAFGGEEKE